MATLEELVIQLAADTQNLRAELQSATKITEQATNRMEKAVEDLGKNSEKNLTFFESALASMAGFLGSQAVLGAVDKLREAFAFLGGELKDGVQAVMEEDLALQRLANSLALSGQYTEQAMLSLQDFADQMEVTANVEADLVAKNLALLSSLTRLDSEGLKQAQQAAIDMSAALGMDLQTATMLVAKGINGNTEAFKRYGIEIEKGQSSTENFSNVVNTLGQRFGGSAAGAMNTFSGALTSAQLSYDKFRDEIAKSIAQNPVVIAMIRELSNIFQDLANNVTDSGSTFKQDFANAILGAMTLIGETVIMIDNFIRIFEAGLRAILLPINAVADGLRLIGDALDGSLDSEAFANTKAQWDDLSKTIEGDTALESIGKGFLRVRDAGAMAFDDIANSSGAASASIANQTGELDKLTEAQKKQQEELKKFAEELAASGAPSGGGSLELLQAQKEAELLTEQEFLIAKGELLRAQMEAEAQMLADARAQDLIDEETYQNALLGLQQKNATAGLKLATERNKMEETLNKQRISAVQGMFANLATLQQSSSKELAAIGKAAALSQATIDGILAVQKALASAPPPFNYALAASVGVATAQNISKIMGVGLQSGITEVPRNAGGGNLGDNFPAILKPGERVVDSETNQDLKKFLAGQGKGQSISISVNVMPGTGINREQVEMIVGSLNDYFTSGGQKLVGAT